MNMNARIQMHTQTSQITHMHSECGACICKQLTNRCKTFCDGRRNFESQQRKMKMKSEEIQKKKKELQNTITAEKKEMKQRQRSTVWSAARSSKRVEWWWFRGCGKGEKVEKKKKTKRETKTSQSAFNTQQNYREYFAPKTHTQTHTNTTITFDFCFLFICCFCCARNSVWLKCVSFQFCFFLRVRFVLQKTTSCCLSLLYASLTSQNFYQKYLILAHRCSLRFSLSEHFLCYLNSCTFTMDSHKAGQREEYKRAKEISCTIHFAHALLWCMIHLMHTVAYF